MRNMATTTQIDPPGLSPKKTLFVMVTVVGCIAILWPKVFYPMMFGGPIKQNTIKDHRGGTEKSYMSACCEVILDKDAFLNESLAVGERTYRKHINLYTGEISLRQERPPHLRPDTIHPAMRERGRAIPSTPTIPIVERARTPSSPPRVVEGRPGPIPGMRPPLGAGSVHQAPQKTSSMGFIMPLYTIGIIAFFIYTIMKILFKKPVSNAPYGPPRSDPSFHKEVFGHEKSCCSGTKLGLLDAADEQLKLRENSTNLNKNNNNNNSNENINDDNENVNYNDNNENNKKLDIDNDNVKSINTSDIATGVTTIDQQQQNNNNDIIKFERKKLDDHSERSVVVLGMELTASCEGGQKWNRPPTPIFIQPVEHSTTVDEDKPDPQPIYLEGALPHESKILVADSKTEKENIVDEEFNGSVDEPAVVLSSKMTLSLISLDADSSDENHKEDTNDKDSPLDNDMEIINGEEQEDIKQPPKNSNDDNEKK